MKKIVVILSIMSLALAILSCERRPLEDPGYETEINIVVDVNAICNVTCDVYNEKIPIPEIEASVMRAMFYHPTEDKLITETFVSQRGTNDQGEEYIGGSVSIIPGKYRFLIYAFGTETTQIHKYDSFDFANAYTDELSENTKRRLSLKAAPEEELPQTILYQPDHLLVARSYEENIPYHAGVYTIHAKASSVVESYYLQIKVEGLEHVSSAQAILKGMAPSTHLATAEMNQEDPSAIYIPLIKSDDKGQDVICNVFNTFGRIPEGTNDLTVTFDVTRVDGKKFTQAYNISDLFYTEDCINHHWLLLEEVIVIPEPEPGPSSGGGFDPAVVDWNEEKRDLIL